jgi:hypothetical protein
VTAFGRGRDIGDECTGDRGQTEGSGPWRLQGEWGEELPRADNSVARPIVGLTPRKQELVLQRRVGDMVHGVRAPCVATPLNVVGQTKRGAVGVGRHGDWWNLARIVALNVASLQIQGV